MLTKRNITLTACHLPDEYVDSVISFGAETSENQEVPPPKDVLASLLPLHWLRSDKKETKEDSHVIMTALNECHLPGEYIDVPVLCSFHDDDSDTSDESEVVQSTKNLLSFIIRTHWFRSNDDTKNQLSKDLFGTSDMTLDECHLPDEYVDTIVSFDSSGSEASSPPKDLIQSLVTWFGSKDNATKKTPRAMNNVFFFDDCHLPDEYVDVVSTVGTVINSVSKTIV